MAQNGQENGWHPARLIPTVGIRGQEEQEKRATSSLLAVMRAVPEFGHALVGPLGAPKGRISTYAEVQLKDADGRIHIPDGAIVVERGKTSWCCLVEVKTGAADLKPEQVNRYLDMARENRFDAVLTISNQITSAPTDSPVSVDGRKLRSVQLVHLSWWRILTEAIVQHRHRGVSDPDQAWILEELIAYLDDERSGASGFRDMGENWVAVRNGAGDGPYVQGMRMSAMSLTGGSSSSSTCAWGSAKTSAAMFARFVRASRQRRCGSTRTAPRSPKLVCSKRRSACRTPSDRLSSRQTCGRAK